MTTPTNHPSSSSRMLESGLGRLGSAASRRPRRERAVAPTDLEYRQVMGIRQGASTSSGTRFAIRVRLFQNRGTPVPKKEEGSAGSSVSTRCCLLCAHSPLRSHPPRSVRREVARAATLVVPAASRRRRAAAATSGHFKAEPARPCGDARALRIRDTENADRPPILVVEDAAPAPMLDRREEGDLVGLLVEEVVGRVRHKRLITDVC
jgi:hypothetical protein